MRLSTIRLPSAYCRKIQPETLPARPSWLDLTQPCGASGFPGARLISNVHGSDTICSPLDVDLRIDQTVGDISQPCFVKKMSEVPANKIASIKNHKP
jgi:hypothetical protein